MKNFKQLLSCISLLVLGLMLIQPTQASETRVVETDGTIGFTGVYIPKGTPEPVPEIGRIPGDDKNGSQVSIVTKQAKGLPKTNMVKQPSLIFLGGLLLVLALLGLLRRQKKSIK